MSRITVDARNTIISKLIERAHGDEVKALEGKRKAFGDKVYNRIFTPDMRKHMDALPDWMFELSDQLDIKVDNSWNSLSLSNVHKQPNRYNWRHDLTAEEKKEYSELEKEKNVLRATKDSLKSKLRGIFASCTTFGKLVKIWPEVKEFITPYVGGTIPNLPAVIPAALNKELKLP